LKVVQVLEKACNLTWIQKTHNNFQQGNHNQIIILLHKCANLIFANVIHDAIHVFEAWIEHQNNHVMNFISREGFCKTYKRM
jgi:hypothetical protein